MEIIKQIRINLYLLLVISLILISIFTLFTFSLIKNISFTLIVITSLLLFLIGIILLILTLSLENNIKKKTFLILTGISAICPFIFTILHNLFYTLSEISSNYFIIILMKILHIISFFIALIVSPIVFLISIIISIILINKNN